MIPRSNTCSARNGPTHRRVPPRRRPPPNRTIAQPPRATANGPAVATPACRPGPRPSDHDEEHADPDRLVRLCRDRRDVRPEAAPRAGPEVARCLLERRRAGPARCRRGCWPPCPVPSASSIGTPATLVPAGDRCVEQPRHDTAGHGARGRPHRTGPGRPPRGRGSWPGSAVVVEVEGDVGEPAADHGTGHDPDGDEQDVVPPEVVEPLAGPACAGTGTRPAMQRRPGRGRRGSRPRSRSSPSGRSSRRCGAAGRTERDHGERHGGSVTNPAPQASSH